MATSQVDDRDSAVVYSQPASGHHWSPIGSSTSYDGTVTLTRHGGATATIDFTGTSITVYGLISPSGTGSTPSSSYTIDGGTPQVYNAVMTSSVQSQVQFFASSQLSPGQHTLVVTNLVEGAYFWLDSFLITPSSSVTTAAAAAAAQNTQATTPSASASSPDPGSQASTAVLTRLITSEVVVGSSTFTTVSTQTTNSVVSASTTSSISHALTTSESDSSHSGSGSSSGNSSDSSTTTRSKTPLGAIIGGVIGGIAVLTLIIALILFFRRRDRKTQRDEVHPWPRGPSSITPFSPPPDMSQSSDTYPYGGFDQRLLASGHPGAAYLAHLPPAQATGKRQVTTPNDRSASSAGLFDAARHREEERLRGNASPSSGSGGTRHHRFNSESHQGSSNGSSIYTDVQHGYPVNYPEDSPPAYQTGPPRDAEGLLGELGIARNP